MKKKQWPPSKTTLEWCKLECSSFYRDMLSKFRYTVMKNGEPVKVADTKVPSNPIAIFNQLQNSISVSTYTLPTLRVRELAVDGNVDPSQFDAAQRALSAAWRSVTGKKPDVHFVQVMSMCGLFAEIFLSSLREIKYHSVCLPDQMQKYSFLPSKLLSFAHFQVVPVPEQHC